MATTPTFSSSVLRLKSELRLSKQPDGDGEAQVASALLEVKSGFIRELGSARITVLQALAFSENPVTSDQALRAVANLTEVKWVRVVLMRTLPMLFMDASVNQNQIYHDEATFRASSEGRLETERIALENEIEKNLDLLRGDTSVGNEGRLKISSPQQACPDPLPGGTLFSKGHLGGHFL